MTGFNRLCAEDEFQALEQLHALGCTDGLPVVVPLPHRVERMVLAGGVDPDVVMGEIGPNLGMATVEKIAVNAVMAGCEPDVFPVVLACIKALCDPVLDMTEVQSTTHNLGPLVIVNGPVRHTCRIASGTGALGPGYRANATIGRAVRLCLINIGGGRPGISDMALLGHPGKFTYCLAEDEESSPFPPLHTSLGFSADESTVTVVCVEAPHSVMTFIDADDPAGADRLLTACARALSSVAANNAHFAHRTGTGTQVLVLNPEHAGALAAAGYDRRRIQQTLHERAGNKWADLCTVYPYKGVDPEAFVRSIPAHEYLLVVVAGGPGVYSSVMPSWGGGLHGNISATKRIELNQFCEIPGL
jgi:hypothetical protein